MTWIYDVNHEYTRPGLREWAHLTDKSKTKEVWTIHTMGNCSTTSQTTYSTQLYVYIYENNLLIARVHRVYTLTHEHTYWIVYSIYIHIHVYLVYIIPYIYIYTLHDLQYLYQQNILPYDHVHKTVWHFILMYACS